MIHKIIQITFLLLVSIFTVAFVQIDTNTTVKCRIQMQEYSGESAYVIISLIDSEGNYVKTLNVAGDDEDWYNEINQWWSYYGKKRYAIDAITGATLAPANTALRIIKLDSKYINTGYKIRIETAVEDQEYYKDEIEFEISNQSLNTTHNGKGFIKSLQIASN